MAGAPAEELRLADITSVEGANDFLLDRYIGECAASVAGTLAFGADGTVFAAVGAGGASAEGHSNSVLALDPKTLEVKDRFTQPGADFHRPR